MSLFQSSLLFHKKSDEKLARKISYAIVATVLLLIFGLFTENVFAAGDGEDSKSKFTIETIYHVFYGNERLGLVDDQQLIEDYKQQLIDELTEEYDDYDFTFSKPITIIPENVFNIRANNEATIELLSQKIDVQASTYKVTIGDVEVGHVNRDEDYDEFVRAFILNYVNEEEYEDYLERELSEDELEKLEAGKSLITNVDLSDEVKWTRSSADADDLLTVKQLIKKMEQGTLEQEVYTVQQGDVLGTIANSHGLSLSEIKEINPGITEDSLLQIGDELNVTVLRPMVSVIVEKVSKREESISYKTETKDNSDMWRGETRVSQEGRDGKKIVEFKTVYENGRSVTRETIAEEVIQEPVNKVVQRGTKTSPSRGSGQLAWPAVGGYVSSHFGQRWGRMHRGIDIARPSNFNILAADNGTVQSAGWENGYGNTIRINHNNGMVTVYAHLASMNVSRGQTVAKGQVIGRMGSTGNSTGIHLHFEVHENGQVRNPMNYLRR